MPQPALPRIIGFWSPHDYVPRPGHLVADPEHHADPSQTATPPQPNTGSRPSPTPMAGSLQPVFHESGSHTRRVSMVPLQPPAESLDEFLQLPHVRAYLAGLAEPPPEPNTRSPPGPPILFLDVSTWGIRFYIRVDRTGGRFYTYPCVNGAPFPTAEDAEAAIDRHLLGFQDRKMLMGLSPLDCAVQLALYWPDGTRKKRLRSQPISNRTRDSDLQLAESLVDKYNDDHNLPGDLAYELKGIVCCQCFHEGGRLYCHYNLTAKTRGTAAADEGCKLFFAEVLYRIPSSDLLASICMLEPADDNDNGSYCYGCKKHGSGDLKHPDHTDFVGGHMERAFVRYCAGKTDREHFDDEDTEEELEAEKARLRRRLEGFDVVYNGNQQMVRLARKHQGDDASHETKRMRTLTMEHQGKGEAA